MPTHPFDGVVHAPDFPPGATWLNTDRPLSLADLRGKIILLDFWTYGCINCLHVLPELKRLERQYPQELVVIGVHAAKFTAEKNTDAIRQAILRHQIEHPVVSDPDFFLWKQYTIRAWPSFVLINPRGRVVGAHSGEGIYPLFNPLIARLIAHFDTRGQLNRSPLHLTRETPPASALRFPGKIHATPTHLYIADTGHHRILITDPTGTGHTTLGTGASGRTDGPFETATFHHPRGLFVHQNHLYIADTENHLIRRADLTTRTVRTVLGTGQQATRPNRPGTGTSCPLNSPWDLLMHSNICYIAMAGAHQLWRADLAAWHASPHAGSAREDLEDGPHLAAALAQPSGLTTDGQRLYFTDSETSAIRTADLPPFGHVQTLTGTGLFHFGDTDGPAPNARLQHPLGLVWHNGRLYIADTYNHKIKALDPHTQTVTTLAGTGHPGKHDGPAHQAQFNEPSGLSAHHNRLFIADTNNHAIRTLDLATQTVTTLPIQAKMANGR